jgi:hypothetical protein
MHGTTNPKDSKCTYNVAIEASTCNHCDNGKARNITYSECVFVALVIQHAMRMRRIGMSSLAFKAVQKLCTLTHKLHDFRVKKSFEHKMCSDFLYNFCLKHTSFQEELSEI